MSSTQRLAELGITLPVPSAPAAAYVPFTRQGDVLYISGQLPLLDGKVAITGKLGANISLDLGQKAARLCALNILAQVKAATGDLNRVARIIKLGGFIASTPEFIDHHKVMNGASELMHQIFGETGQHARFAVGVAALPMDAAVEIEAIIAIYE